MSKLLQNLFVVLMLPILPPQGVRVGQVNEEKLAAEDLCRVWKVHLPLVVEEQHVEVQVLGYSKGEHWLKITYNLWFFKLEHLLLLTKP